MKRRDFITKAGLGTAAVAGATLAAPALAQEREKSSHLRVKLGKRLPWTRNFSSAINGKNYSAV